MRCSTTQISYLILNATDTVEDSTGVYDGKLIYITPVAKVKVCMLIYRVLTLVIKFVEY